jgi:hypothetical protein
MSYAFHPIADIFPQLEGALLADMDRTGRVNACSSAARLGCANTGSFIATTITGDIVGTFSAAMASFGRLR